MILVWGSPDDSPVVRVIEELDTRGADYCHIEDVHLSTLRYDLLFTPTPKGWIEYRKRRIRVEELSGAYVRPGESPKGPAQTAAVTLLALTSVLRSVVINRPTGGRSNSSKPYQLCLIEDEGLRVPETLVTTNPEVARAFLRKHGRLVYKSLSGIRSIVATLDPGNEGRLENVRTGPVQFQEFVPGLDVRVHVVGNRWFACSIRSESTDYRYTATGAELAAFELPESIGKRLIRLVRRMGLVVGGVDLRLTPKGSWVCFEVNPSPGFPWYEESTGHPIAESIVDLLTGKKV